MKPLTLVIVPLSLLFAIPSAAATLEEVASFPKQQVTGVGVSKTTGRVFVNFPYWSAEHSVSVAEIKEGKPIPFPDGAWNSKEGDAAKRFVCVQSVVVDDADNLWILDTGSPLQKGVVKGGAKLVQVALKTDQVVRTIPIGEDCAPEKSYLNDLRIDVKKNHVFITESGIGSLVVVNLETGKATRFLAGHASTKAEVGTELLVDGIKPIDPATKGTPTFHADGIALDVKNSVLYYHPLTGHSLYKVSTSVLMDPNANDAKVESAVEKVGETPAPDGMLETPDGNVLLAAFEKNAVIKFDPGSGKSSVVVQDEKLQWPDTMAWGPDQWLYVTTSQIHRTPKYNAGESKLEEPFRVYRLKVGK
jgi:sugar lactone lactonase YvrE